MKLQICYISIIFPAIIIALKAKLKQIAQPGLWQFFACLAEQSNIMIIV
jgi:hypothetical protein